jgi:Na+/phosphate symporter
MADVAEAKRWRHMLGWAASAALLLVYWGLSEGDDAYAPQAVPRTVVAVEAQRLTISDVQPSDPTPGSALAISYSGVDAQAQPRIWLGRTELAVLARRAGFLVAQLPAGLAPGRIKIRATAGSERSKTFELRVKAVNWRKPFRNLCGGLALLVLGVQTLALGARGVLGFANAQHLAALTRPSIAAAGFGVLAGALTQSTTAVAGLLAGLTSSRALTELSAAAAFLGATLGAALAPLALANVAQPHWGLPALAIGTLLLGLARDRRSKAAARLMLGVGLVAFGVQVLRPDFEPFVSSARLLAALDGFAPGGLLGSVSSALLGAGLVALFQGPAPVLILALAIAELTGHQSTRSILALLSGSGLGAALAALLTTSHRRRFHRFARLNLLAGACGTLLTAATVEPFSRLSDLLAAGHAHAIWNGKHLLSPIAWPVIVAFALSQLTAAAVLLPLLPRLQRWVERSWPERAAVAELPALLAERAVRDGLCAVLGAQQAALPSILELALDGLRGSGRRAEHQLAEAHSALDALFAGPLLALPARPSVPTAADLGRIALACQQLQRSFEALLEQAERLTESRILCSQPSAGALTPSVPEQALLREVHGLIAAGLSSALTHLRAQSLPDADETRAREIRLNATEASTRRALLADGLESHHLQQSLGLIELIAAYEMTGNQLYRLAEALDQAHREGSAPSPSQLSSPPTTTTETGRA